MTTAIARILDGAVDLHCHSSPSPMPRRITHVEAARQAAEWNFRAIVVKCHYHSTAFDVIAMDEQLAGVPTQVFGGVALNSQVGGLNPHAVDLTLKMGGKMVWFPTISAGAHLCRSAHDESIRSHFVPRGVLPSEEVDVFGPDGDLRPEVEQILDIAKAADAVVSAGHLAPDRVTALLERAHAMGLRRLVVSHPDFVIDAAAEQVKRFAELGATIEHCLGLFHEDKHLPFQDLLDWIELIGPDHTSLASDLGQVGNVLPVEAYVAVCERLLDSGVAEADVRRMVVDNPARLLGLEL
jgi:hypothetical protein